MTRLTLTIFLALILVSTTFAAEKPRKKLMDNYIAVFDLATQGKVDKDISRPLTESIRRELVGSGKYEVIDRSNMDKILDEQKFQKSGCVTGECIIEAGQLLGVGKIITGSISIVGKTYYLILSLINVQSGKIEKVSEDKCKCEADDLIDASKRLAKKLFGEDGFIFTDLTALHEKTGLMWTRDANIAGKSMTSNDARDYIRQLNKQRYAGYDDWGLPLKEELETLIYHIRSKDIRGNYYKWLNKVGFRNVQPDYYWLMNFLAVLSGDEMDIYWLGGEFTNAPYPNQDCFVWPVRMDSR